MPQDVLHEEVIELVPALIRRVEEPLVIRKRRDDERGVGLGIRELGRSAAVHRKAPHVESPRGVAAEENAVPPPCE